MIQPLKLAVFTLFTLGATLAHAADPAALKGTLRLTGSDSIDPLVRLWSQEFQKRQPEVAFAITSHGSTTAPPALIDQKADIGHMSRPMNDTERASFQARFGHGPTEIPVGFDALAIFVNRKNPVRTLSIEQLDAIFGATRLTGAPEPLEGWWQLSLKPHRVNRYWIRPYGRDEQSGSRAFFTEKVLQKGGRFREDLRVEDQMGILEAIGKNLNAIGFGPESYRNPLVRMVPVIGLRQTQPYLPTLDNIQTGRYPLSRTLYFYVNREPGGDLSPLVRAFLEFVLSPAGQDLAKGYGSAPLSPDMAQAQLAKVK